MRHAHGTKFVKFREQAGLTQAQVAKALGLSSPQFVSNWERGNAAPPVKTLPTLSVLYKVPLRRLFNAYMNIQRDHTMSVMSRHGVTTKRKAELQRVRAAQ